MQANTIDQVISFLEEIIEESKTNNSPMGYFAALYQKVTIKVKEGIENNYFDDGPRMEKLDIVFANRYLEAYYAQKKKEAVTTSWQKAFAIAPNYWPIVLQHLLIGMNAHINLDLGIAAAEVSKGKDIDALENDFKKINDVLSSLVKDVQNDLAKIWPALKIILKLTGKADDFLVDFSMEIARDGAWKFANQLAEQQEDDWIVLIEERDEKVANKAKIVTHPGFIISGMMKIVRIGERGTVKKKIEILKD